MPMFDYLVLGHFVGDFMLQPKWMALHKADKGLHGLVLCILHAVIYTLAISVMSGVWNIAFMAAIGIPHFFVDRYSLAAHHLHFIGGRTYDNVDDLDPWDRSFTTVMYVVVDMTIHLLLLAGVSRLMLVQ